MPLLAIDPGANSGWAFFDSARRLSACGLGNAPEGLIVAAGRALIERPKIYPRGRTKNPNDVLAVAVSAGEHGGRCKAAGAQVDYVEPRSWKGTIDKATHHARVLERLDARETAIVDRLGLPKSKRHNVLDAVALGLFGVGRLGP